MKVASRFFLPYFLSVSYVVRVREWLTFWQAGNRMVGVFYLTCHSVTRAAGEAEVLMVSRQRLRRECLGLPRLFGFRRNHWTR